jgi:cell wall-associated NlpC family hydrolase
VALAVAAVATITPMRPAGAIWNDVATGSVTTKFCWQWFGTVAYGSGFEIKMRVVNNTPNVHTASVSVSGGNAVTTSVAPGTTATLPSAVVSKNLNQKFTYKMDGASTAYTSVDWRGIRGYMNNCQTQSTTNTTAREAMRWATSKVGDRYTGGGAGIYRMGAVATTRVGPFQSGSQSTYWLEAGNAGFDCSGLTSKAYEAAGVPGVPQSTAGLDAAKTKHIADLGQRRAGDLLFKVGHVGMYLGTGQDGKQWVVEATPWRKWAAPGGGYDAEGVTITEYSTFINGGPYKIYRA